MQLNKLIMAKKHTDISDEQQMALADIQANPKLLFTPEYSKWRDFLRRESPNYVDSLYNNLPQDVQYDIYMNNREGFGALSDKVKNNYKANLGAAQTRGAIGDAGQFIWDEVVPWIPVLGTAKDWGEFFIDPTLENLAWAGLGTVSDSGVVKGVRRIVNGVRSKKLLNTIDEVADRRKDQFAGNFDLGKYVSKDTQSYLANLQKRGVLSKKEVVDYSDRFANAKNANEVSIIHDELRRRASNNIAKGVVQTAAGTAGDVFIANEQRLQQQGEEPWLINISNQPWAKWNLIEDVPYIIRDAEPDPRDYAKGGRLMITKRNTYRPHYFGNGGGDFQEVTEEGSPNIYQQQLNQQGFGQQSQNSNSGIGWQAGLGAAAGIAGQVGVNNKNPNGLYDTLDPVHYLANGRHGAGDGVEKAGVGVFQAGASSGNPWLMLAGAGLKIAGGIANAGWGHKTDEEQLARINQGIDAANNFQSNVSSFDDLQNPMVLANAGNVYEGGWFNKKKWKKKNEELQANVAEAQANVYNQFNNNVSNLQQDQMNSMLANYAAFGGPLHTHGSDWTNGITIVDNGGSHESNPYGGVPMGIAQDGQQNLVEEGEVIYKLNGSPYVYSKRLKMSKELKDKYKFKGDTFADGALEAQKESEERPNDPISQRGLNAIMRDLANEQEKKRAEKAERQAKYAFGGWLANGHKFATGSVMDGPPPRILFKGKYPLTLASDGLHYEGDVMGSRYKVTAKDAFANPDDYSILLDEVDAIAQRNQIPSTRKTLQHKEVTGSQADYADAYQWNELHDKLGSQYKGWLANYMLGDPANSLEKMATQRTIWNKTEDGIPYISNAGEVVNSQRGNFYNPFPSTYIGNVSQVPEFNSQQAKPASNNQETVTPVTTTTTPTTSKTGKGTGTTGVKGNRAVDQADWDRAKSWFLSSNKESYLNTISDAHWKELQDKFPKLKDYTPEQWVARAESGNIGPVYNAMMDIYNTEKPYLDYGTIDAKGTNKKALWDFYSNNKPDYFTGNQAESYVGPDGRVHTTSLEGFSTADENYLNSLGNIKGDSITNWTSIGDTQKSSGTTANGANNPIDNYKTWMRYAPIFGSGLALALDPWINRPDYTNADMVLEAGKSAGNVDFTPIGDYLSYKPYDRLFYANQLAANQAATRRALLNTTGGNAATARGLLLAADNQGINQMGNLWRQAEEYNAAQRQAVADFNRGTNIFNSEGFLKADMANQGQGNVRINAAIEAAKLRALEDDRVAETRSANFTNFLDNLGDLGRENLYYNMVNNNNALYYGQNKRGESIYKGEGSTNNPVTMPMPIQQYTKTGKNGGYLTIKKKKR